MLKAAYKILKYINQNPNVSKLKLQEKFSDFEKYETYISEYVFKTNNNVDIEQNTEEKLILKAQNLGFDISQTSKYIKENMENIKNVTDNGLILYSTNLRFDEYKENQTYNAWLFWFPYTITTLIAIASIISQFIK